MKERTRQGSGLRAKGNVARGFSRAFIVAVAAAVVPIALIAEQQQPGHSNDGRPHGYGLGLFVGTYKGLHEVYHSGSTAGYSAFLEKDTLRGRTWAFNCRGGAIATDEYGTTETYERVTPWSPAPQDLEAFAGTYVSDDAETVITAVVEAGTLRLKRRPDATITLTPIYANAFGSTQRFSVAQLGTVIFRRDGSGRPSEFSVVQDRVWNMRFQRSR